MNAARLLIPAIRAGADGRFEAEWPRIRESLEFGVGGFILFGGEAAAARDLIAAIRREAPHPLLIGSDLERGAGQQFLGATPLPPIAAIGSLNDLEVTRSAGYLTAAEATAIGINWIFAPVADLDVEPRNPIVATRAFGDDPHLVGAHVAAWIRGCHEGGALACAKHFPGHGRTTGDSHVERTVVSDDRQALEMDLIPFRNAVAAKVDSVMTAHVAYPALDPTGEVATLSPAILRDLLRDSLSFEGLVVSDALGMAGLSEGMGEGRAAVRALEAGCDLLLYPEDQQHVVNFMARALSDGDLKPDRVVDALGRLDAAIGRFAAVPESGRSWGTDEARLWAEEIASRSLAVLRGSPGGATEIIDVVVIDDDLGGPLAAPSRSVFVETLQRGARLHPAPGGAPLIALYADPRAWKGRAGLSGSAVRDAQVICAESPATQVVLFGHPRLADELPFARHVLCAWGGEPLMQGAAARWLSSPEVALAGESQVRAG